MLKRQDFFFEVPQNLIAQKPIDIRDKSRLLVCNKIEKKIENMEFYNIPKILNEKLGNNQKEKKILLILNDSKVYPARIRIQRKTGARGEVFLLENGQKNVYRCLLRPQNKLKVGEILLSDQTNEPILRVESLNPPLVSIQQPHTLDDLFENFGEMPLPPYITRDPLKVDPSTEMDKIRYQTVYSNQNKVGSAAAPTAGLHFTENTLKECLNSGIEFAYTTLHVGLGTFISVQSENINAHKMHEEFYQISSETLNKISEYLKNNWPIVFVGTTSLRSVESFFLSLNISQLDAISLAQQNKLEEFAQDKTNNWHSTNLFIYPKNSQDIYSPIIGNAIITNFHQPESTLSMLIAALMGYDFWKEFYSFAIAQKYRFFSYGDSSLLIFK